MRRVTRNGVIAVAAASGAMAMTLPAFADSGASGTAAGSPGFISGNNVQVPVHLPVNLCGNTVNVVGLLNPAAGNTCANVSSGHQHDDHGKHGAKAYGEAAHSPGAVSGNEVQVPVDVPVNATGNSLDVVGILNPAFDNKSGNISEEEPAHPAEPPVRHTPPAASEPGPTIPKTMPPDKAPQAPAPEATAPVAHAPSLARTGADATAPALLGSTALILGGALLYRRFRPGAER
ncbi:chaplin family protein [Streptomyces sp. NPDC017936]|uniref:chaplin n=1 Tax=Streptomyces sp. NPDC017936 TaxID=3365016 RepID=UPI00379963CA